MTLALLFPGQGSQSVGMGVALADAFASAREVYAEVDEALGQKLSVLMREGPEDQLTLTENAQPALMAVSLAAVRVLKVEFGVDVTRAAFVAGHSLGEYSALCAAGYFSLSTTAGLLQLRGQAMQRAVPVGMGAMASLIGPRTDLALAEAAAAAGSEVGVEPLRVPLVANVTARPVVGDWNELKWDIRRLLVEQVTGRVRWRESMEWMATEGGVTRFAEIGSGKVLAGMARRIAPDAESLSLNTPEDLEAFAKSL